jgi:hypothetical protein
MLGNLICHATRFNEEQKNPIILRLSFRAEKRGVFTGIYIKKHDCAVGMAMVAGSSSDCFILAFCKNQIFQV